MRALELLAIDVASELRILCREQLQGDWQIAAELARLALQRGASEIAFRRGRRGFDLECRGAVLTERELTDLCAVLDPNRDDQGRHSAIVRLEEAEAQALMWLAGVDAVRIELASRAPTVSLAVAMRPGALPILEKRAIASDTIGLTVRLRSATLDRVRTLKWFRHALRFSPVPVLVDGEQMRGGFGRGIFERHIDGETPCRIAITNGGDTPLLWLLRHGVLATRAHVPGYPAFEAAVELGNRVPAGAAPAELREAVNPLLPWLVDEAVIMMIHAAGQLPDLHSQHRERLTCLLLRAARTRVRRDLIFELPLVQALDGEGQETWLSLRDLDEDGGELVFDSGDGGSRVVAEKTVRLLRLSAEQRCLLGMVLGKRLRQVSRGSRGVALRRLGAALRKAADSVAQQRWWLFGIKTVSADELLCAEGALLAELNRWSAATFEVRLCAGGGRIRRRGRLLLLPRHNPLVLRSAQLLNTDERWIYPVVLALLDERVRPLDELREQFASRIAENDFLYCDSRSESQVDRHEL